MDLVGQNVPPYSPAAVDAPSEATFMLGAPFSPTRYAMAVSTVLALVSLLLLGLTFY